MDHTEVSNVSTTILVTCTNPYCSTLAHFVRKLQRGYIAVCSICIQVTQQDYVVAHGVIYAVHIITLVSYIIISSQERELSIC